MIYYFASKEELAAACFLKAIDAFEALISVRCERADFPPSGCVRFVRGYVAQAREVALGALDPLAVFNDVRALNDAVVNLAYTRMFRNARGLLGPSPRSGPDRQALNAVTHLLLSQLFWSVVWLPLYDPEDYDRVANRLLDVLENGLGRPGRGVFDWPLAAGGCRQRRCFAGRLSCEPRDGDHQRAGHIEGEQPRSTRSPPVSR